MTERIEQYCVEGCGRETGYYTNTGRRSKLWCTECDEVRIARIDKQLHEIEANFNAKRG
jgi:hypothetical protein